MGIIIKIKEKMKKYCFLTYMSAFAFLSTTMLSCSSDENEIYDSEKDLPRLVAELSTQEKDGTRAGLSVNNVADPNKPGSKTTWTMNWYADDYVWVYSPSQHYFNRLVPHETTKEFGSTDMEFATPVGDKIDYTPNENMIFVYCGEKSGNNTGSGPYTGNILTFSRINKPDNVSVLDGSYLALIYGKISTSPYNDEGNPFCVRATAAKVLETGKFATSLDGKDQSDINVINYMPFIRIGIPAAKEDDVTGYKISDLSKLDYEITVSFKTVDHPTEGYPNTVCFQFLDEISERGMQRCLEFPSTGDYITWGEPLSISLTANSEDNGVNSSSLWRLKSKSDEDKTEGYIFIPFPIVKDVNKYTELKVTVVVTNNSGDTSLDKLCGTYTYINTGISFTKKDGSAANITTMDDNNFKEPAQKIYSLGNIWDNGSAQKGNKWTFTANTTE